MVSVLSRSPLEKVIVAPGVSRPLTPSTASVARSPETMRRGKSRIRAAEGAGAAGARAGDFCCAAKGKPKLPAIRQAAMRNWRRATMRGIVVENFIARKGVCEWKKCFFCEFTLMVTSWSVTRGSIFPARAASNPRETQVFIEYEYQYMYVMIASASSPKPLRRQGVRQSMDLKNGSDRRHAWAALRGMARKTK